LDHQWDDHEEYSYVTDLGSNMTIDLYQALCDYGGNNVTRYRIQPGEEEENEMEEEEEGNKEGTETSFTL
jgi:hypothetical protein